MTLLARQTARLLAFAVALTACSRVATAQDELATAAIDPQAVDLRPHFEEGRGCRYQIWSLRSQAQSIQIGPNSREFDTQFELNGQVTWVVDRVKSDGSATCTMTMDWLTADLTGPEGDTQRSDSRQGRGEPETVHQLLRALTGVAVRVEVGADGSVRSASNIDAISRNAPEGIKVPDELDFMESANELALVPGVPDTVAVGAQWDQRFVWNHELGKLTESLRFTLENVDLIEGVPVAMATAGGKADLQPDLDRMLKDMKTEARVDVRMTDGSVETQVYFDLDRHEAIGRNTLAHRRIELDVRVQNHKVKRVMDETIHSQVLRIEEW